MVGSLLYDLFPEPMTEVIETQASRLKKPPMSSLDLLSLLENSVPTFVSRFGHPK